MTTILRFPAVKAEIGKSRTATYNDIKSGLFTRPVKLGPRTVGWPSHEVQAINRARISGLSDEEIRALVVRLESQRKQQPH